MLHSLYAYHGMYIMLQRGKKHVWSQRCHNGAPTPSEAPMPQFRPFGPLLHPHSATIGGLHQHLPSALCMLTNSPGGAESTPPCQPGFEPVQTFWRVWVHSASPSWPRGACRPPPPTWWRQVGGTLPGWPQPLSTPTVLPRLLGGARPVLPSQVGL